MPKECDSICPRIWLPTLKIPCTADVLFHLVYTDQECFDTLTTAQREAVRQFLLLRLSHNHREFHHPTIEAALAQLLERQARIVVSSKGIAEQSDQPEPRAARFLKSTLVGRGPVNRVVRFNIS